MFFLEIYSMFAIATLLLFLIVLLGTKGVRREMRAGGIVKWGLSIFISGAILSTVWPLLAFRLLLQGEWVKETMVQLMEESNAKEKK